MYPASSLCSCEEHGYIIARSKMAACGGVFFLFFYFFKLFVHSASHKNNGNFELNWHSVRYLSSNFRHGIGFNKLD